jgi:hypothetical protein
MDVALKIPHEFTDSLKLYLKSNPDKGLNDWLYTLSVDKLMDFEGLLNLVSTQVVAYTSEPQVLTNKVNDIHHFAFACGRLRSHKTDSINRMKLIGKILSEVQTILIKRESA